MITFYTLGGLDLRDAAGARVGAVLAHPKRTALLAYLALCTPRGFHRRDTLLALFWPELDQEHARAALRKTVHHLRRALGDDVVVAAGDEELGLASERLWCDAVAFERAIEVDDVPGAIELYRGPLLQGFFAPDARGFERWMESERARLRDRAFVSVWRMAEREQQGGNIFQAAFWGRRAATLMPDDEEALRRLLGLLDRLGDRAGAIAAYEEFARHLLQDYDAEPSAETQTLIRTIRCRGAAGEAPSIVRDEPPAAAAEPDAMLAPAVHRRLIGAVAAVVVIAAIAGTWWIRTRGQAQPSPLSATSVAVLPFAFRGAPEYAYLAEGMPSLLGTSLEGAGGLHSADPSALLTPGKGDAGALRDRAKAAELAARFGAGLYVVGDIVEAGGRLRASAALYEARGGSRLLARATAEDTASQVFGLVDRLAGQLVAGRGAEPGERLTRLAATTTQSLAALKAYLEGEQRFRIGHYKEAVDAYQRAVDQDSTFALAYYRLASAYSWSSDTMQLPTAVQAARYAQRLSPSDRELVDAFVAYSRGRADEAERRYRAILLTRPYEGEAWYPLGEVLFHFNPVRGRPIAEAKPVFQKALALGPKDSPLTHLLEIEAIDGDYATFDSLRRGIAPGAHFDLVGRTVHALVSGTESDRRRVLAEIARTPDPELANTARHMLFLVPDRASAARVVRLLLEPERPPEVRALGYIQLAHLEMGAGRRAAADSALAAAEQLDRPRALEHRGLLHSLPFLSIPPAELEATRRALAKWDGEGATGSSLVFPGDEHLHRYFRVYLLGLLDAGLGRHDAALEQAGDLQRLPGSVEQRAFAADLARGVRARVAWERGRADDALAELQAMRPEHSAVEMVGVVPFYSFLPERLLHAEILRAQGREVEALGWYRAFGEHTAFGRAFQAAAQRRLGELHEALGRRDEAERHYTRFVQLWKDCDLDLRPVVGEAVERLARLHEAGAAGALRAARGEDSAVRW